MSSHLKLLQWCIDNTDDNFKVNYNYSLGQSWIGGDATMHCIAHDDVDDTIKWLEEVKARRSPRALAEKRKDELLAELDKINEVLAK